MTHYIQVFTFQRCGNHSLCLWDVALTGKLEMAETFGLFQSAIEMAEVTNEAIRANVTKRLASAKPIRIINSRHSFQPIQAKNIKVDSSKIVFPRPVH